MEKKIFSLVIALVIVLLATIGLVIYSQNTEKPKENVQKNELVRTDIINSADGDGYKTYKSENGYTVRYPEKYTPQRMARAVDFILEDEESKSNLNIVTAKNDGTLKKMTEEDFSASIAETGMDVTMLSYESTDLNGADATVAKYIYNGNEVTQVIVILEDFGYNITVTESPDVSDSVSNELEKIWKSFTLD